MTLVTQTKAAACVDRGSRTVRYWLKSGKLKRRKGSRVALEDVVRLAGPDNTLKKRGVVGGIVHYSRAGRPKRSNALPSPWIITSDPDGNCLVWGMPFQVNLDTPPPRDLADVERLLEIRVLYRVWLAIRMHATVDQIEKFFKGLRDRFTSDLLNLSPLPIETTLFQILRNTPPHEIFVITSRRFYDYVHNEASVDAASRAILRRPIPVKWNPKKESQNAYLQRYFGQKTGRDVRDKEWSVKLTDEERRQLSPKTTDDHDPSSDQERLLSLAEKEKQEIFFRLAEDHPGVGFTTEETRKDFEAWKELNEQADKKTKHGQRMSGMEEYRGKTRPVRLKRWCRFGDLLGTSRRMATYWKRRTSEKYKQVRSELEKLAPIRGTSAEAEAYVERALLAPEPKFNPEIFCKLPVEIIETVLARLKSQGRLTDYDKALARYNRASLKPKESDSEDSGEEAEPWWSQMFS